MGNLGMTVLAEARAVGLEVRVEAGRLVIRGPRSREDQAQRLLAQKHEVLAALTAEDEAVAWRLAVLRPCVPRRGPIPFLAVRDAPPEAGRCLACGDPLGEGRTTRCAPCAEAAWLALHEVREGLESPPASPRGTG